MLNDRFFFSLCCSWLPLNLLNFHSDVIPLYQIEVTVKNCTWLKNSTVRYKTVSCWHSARSLNNCSYLLKRNLKVLHILMYELTLWSPEICNFCEPIFHKTRNLSSKRILGKLMCFNIMFISWIITI